MSKQQIRVLAIFFFIMLLLMVGPVKAALDSKEVQPEIPCDVLGLIGTDTTWSPDLCDWYVVTGNIIVQSGVTLTVEPGTTVKFDSLKAMTIQGRLVAMGTDVSPIIFTSNAVTPIKGDWGYLYFTSTSPSDPSCNGTGSILKYAIVEYSGGANTPDNGAIRIDGVSPCLDNNIIRLNKDDAIHVWNNGTPVISNNSVTDNGIQSPLVAADGIEICCETSISVTNNVVSNNAGTGIKSRGNVAIGYNTITDNGQYGIYVIGGAEGSANVLSNLIANNLYGGLYLTGGSNVIVQNNTVTGNSTNGGIYISSSAATLQVLQNTIQNNSGTGGLTIVGNSSVRFLVANTVENNVSSQSGGGVAISGGYSINTTALLGNMIMGNTTNSDGGGVYLSTNASNMTALVGNTISNNSGRNGGGIVSLIGGRFFFKQNTILNNSASVDGGGMYFERTSSGDTYLIQNAFNLNESSGGGGGLALNTPYNTIVKGNSIVGNVAFTRGAGVYLLEGGEGSVILGTNILTNNVLASPTGKGGGIYVCDNCNLTFNQNDICQNTDGYDGDFYNDNPSSRPDLNAENNYWGVLDAGSIENRVWHFIDDSALSIVDYIPFATNPFSGNPAVCDPPPIGN